MVIPGMVAHAAESSSGELLEGTGRKRAFGATLDIFVSKSTM
jgi:hypothetical protein